MRVIGLTAEWCGKCAQAKKMLMDYPIEWLDVETEIAKFIIAAYDIEKIPTFVVAYDGDDIGLGVDVIHTVLGVKELFEENPI